MCFYIACEMNSSTCQQLQLYSCNKALLVVHQHNKSLISSSTLHHNPPLIVSALTLAAAALLVQLALPQSEMALWQSLSNDVTIFKPPSRDHPVKFSCKPTGFCQKASMWGTLAVLAHQSPLGRTGTHVFGNF